ncbi:MAG: DUF4271 domain-containing protein [Bacteroidales bacterium]|nr:DUF4271 domain-containing protein [Bacteroidales bacterium]MBD5212560.1 DUF4271 domain-containing protein [Bacteroidales bacterium]
MTPADTLLLKATDTLTSDSLAADSVAGDTIPSMVFLNPAPLHSSTTHQPQLAINSWISLTLLLLLAAACIRFRGNPKFITNLFRELTDVRERENAFDDTVRETSFMTLLNIICAASIAVILYITATPEAPDIRAALLCLCASSAYCLFMPPIYWSIGDIFSDRLHAGMWVRGFLASQALLGIGLFPVALVALFYPEAGSIILPLSFLLLLCAKILFISKGFRIFFTKYSSWVTFLYYLCSIEIVPLILTYSLSRFLILNCL